MEFPKSWKTKGIIQIIGHYLWKNQWFGVAIFLETSIYWHKCHLRSYTTKFSDRETRHRKSPHLTSQESMAMDQNPGALPEITGIAGYVYII
jgi:hypothetical protein